MRSLLAVLITASALADTVTPIPPNEGAEGQFIVNGPGFPYTVEVQTGLAVPGATHRWEVHYGYGVARGVPDPRSEFAFNPHLEQYGITPPTGWQLISVNEDQTLALIIREPFNESYDSLFENGVFKSGATIRVLPITDRLQQALMNSSNCFFDIRNVPSKGYIVCGSEELGREIILSSYTVSANESVRFVGTEPGNDAFVFAYRRGFSADIMSIPITVNTMTHMGSFTQEPDPNDPNHTHPVWNMITGEYDWVWGHNRNNRLAKLNVDISLDGKQIRRSINIPVSNPAFHLSLLKCNTGYWANQSILYTGESIYRTGSLPVIVGSLLTASDGKCDITIPYKWDGRVSTSGMACPPPSVAKPTITPNGGSFDNAVSVSLACATTDATIRYTTDGTDPNSNAAIYSEPFMLTSSVAVKARAFKNGFTDSSVASAAFVVLWTPPATMPGDTNCDGSVTFADINPFVLALTSRTQYETEFPGCPYLNADCNNDGYVTFADINAFVDVVANQTGQPVPLVRSKVDDSVKMNLRPTTRPQ